MDRVLIVGGGLTGCALALELRRRGRDVLVLERAVPGAEASSAAAGILAPHVEAHGQEPLRTWGIDSLARWPAWVASLGGDAGFRRVGVTVLGACPDREAIACRGDEEPDLVGGAAGWHLADAGVVDPTQLLPALHTACVREGVAFLTGHVVTRVVAEGVEEERAFHRGTPVVCAGAWTRLVPGAPEVPVTPRRGQLVELRGPGGPRGVVFTGGGYLVPRGGDRVVVGTTVEDVGFDRGVTVEGVAGILARATACFPRLATAELVRAWSSFRPTTPDLLPVLGERDGVWVSSGHYRNGVLLAPLSAAWMADALEGAPLPAGLDPGRFSEGACLG